MKLLRNKNSQFVLILLLILGSFFIFQKVIAGGGSGPSGGTCVGGPITCSDWLDSDSGRYITGVHASVTGYGGGSVGYICISDPTGVNSSVCSQFDAGGGYFGSMYLAASGTSYTHTLFWFTTSCCTVTWNLSIDQSPPSISPSPHLACNGLNACVLTDGVSFDQCTGDPDCTPIPTPPPGGGRLKCSGNSCVLANEAGSNQCSTNSNCIAANPPPGPGGPGPGPGGSSHYACVTSNSCTLVEGAGTNQCMNNIDCTPTPIATIACQTTTMPGYQDGGPCTIQSGQPYFIRGACTNGDETKDYTVRNDTGQVWYTNAGPFTGTPISGSPVTYTTYCYYQNSLGLPPKSASLQIFPPTLSAALTANPNSGASPLGVTLTATAGGTAVGAINYSFWWNCANNTTSVATATTACGALPNPGLGLCSSNANGLKCNAMNVTTYTPIDVVWQNPVGVNVFDNNLTKNTGSDGWDGSGASSNRGFSGDGSLTFTANEVTTFRYIGLSNDTTHKNNKIDYGIYLAGPNANGIQELYVVENGVPKLNASPGDPNTWYTTGDILNIIVTSNQVTYWKNGVNIYTSLIAPTYPLFVDTSIYSNGGTVLNAKISPIPSHTYNVVSTAKVIVERGGLSAQAQAPITVIGAPPTASAVTENDPDYCVSGPAYTISWTYSDTSGSPQSAYQVQVTNTGSFNNSMIDTGKVNSGSNSYFTGQGILQFNTTYKSQVRVWNSSGQVSGWAVSNNSKTPLYAYPQVDFYWTSNGILNNPSPPLNRSASFTDQTVFSGNGNPNWSWNFGDSGTSTTQNPSHTYSTEGTYYITLTAVDGQNQSCAKTKGPVIIQKPIPRWREIAPK